MENVVETYRIGNSTVHICDDHVANTPEEVERILDEFHAVGWSIFTRESGEDA